MDHWVNMSSDQQSPTKLKMTVEGSEREKYFMNANKYATKTQIKCHSREAIFWAALKRGSQNQMLFRAESTADSYANEIKLSIFMFECDTP